MLHHLMGLIECRDGQLELGAGWLGRAFDAEPHNRNFRLMFARALIDLRRCEQALVVASPASGSGSADVELCEARADAAHKIGKFDVASEAWETISAARPGDPVAWLNLGRSLLAGDRFSDAEVAYRRALGARAE